jgi:hypothetical protein
MKPDDYQPTMWEQLQVSIVKSLPLIVGNFIKSFMHFLWIAIRVLGDTLRDAIGR